MLSACRPGTPEQYIQPGQMEDILVDYHLARAMALNTKNSGIEEEVYLDAVLKKHGVDRAQFDSSLVYYYIRADRFAKVYERVKNRLDDKALALGATEGEIGKYASLNTSGDTANIWRDQNQVMLTVLPPYNRMDFVIEADSTFLPGDNLLLQFMADFVFQDGMKDAVVYLVAEYPDTMITVQRSFTYSGLIQTRLDGREGKTAKRIAGFFYLGGGNQPSTTMKLLFLNNLQLIRFHRQHVDEQPKIKKDSLASGVDAAAPSDSARGRDSVGSGKPLLPADGRVAPLRVDEGTRTVEK